MYNVCHSMIHARANILLFKRIDTREMRCNCVMKDHVSRSLQKLIHQIKNPSF